jgi:hypothetical protein
VQTVNKQSELTTNVNEAKISTRGRKIIVSNKYRVTDEKPLTLYLTYSLSDLNK